GDWDQAIADCTRALELNPTYALAYSSRGSSYLKKGDWDRALADYNRALELNPNDVRSLFNKALVFDKAGRKQEALEAYGRFLGSAPKSPSKETRARIEQARKRIKVLEKY
ncbi:MAG TPA: tetratricopeptide repeat protein, partial [Desulfobaccales bacterium]